MALSSKWTLDQLRSAVRRELQDPVGRWWSDNELDTYLRDWQDILQNQFEFKWTTNTQITINSTLTCPSDQLRSDAVYIVTASNTFRLAARTRADLDTDANDWRKSTSTAPKVVYQEEPSTLRLWPGTLTQTNTYVQEYPKLCNFLVTQTATTSLSGTATVTYTITNTQAMEVPAWTRYSAVPYCAYRAYSRFGPNQNTMKAMRRKRTFDKLLKRYRVFYDNYMPEHGKKLRPSGRFVANTLYFRGRT